MGRMWRAAASAVAASVMLTAMAAAQDPTPGPSCALTTPEEANAVFAGAGLAYNDNSNGYYCSFGGSFDLVVSLQQETSIDEHKSQSPEGGVDVTVAGMPGWWREAGGNLGVAANGSLLHLNGWGSSDDSNQQLALLTALAERIVPRIPPAADPAVVAGLTALLPAGLESTVVLPGWYLAGSTAGTPSGQALVDALASQDRTPNDLVIVQGGSADRAVLLLEVPGTDAAPMLLPVLSALLPGSADAATSTVEVGGKQVTRIEFEPTLYGYATGSRMALVYGPDDFLVSVFASLP